MTDLTPRTDAPGDVYQLIGDKRFTGGSMSIRSSYTLMRDLGASARAMLVQAAADTWGADPAELTTEPGRLLHPAGDRREGYGAFGGRGDGRCSSG